MTMDETERRCLYVVYDGKGAGRIVGVFDTEGLARRVIAIDPQYYRLHRSEVNHIRSDAIAWLNSTEQRTAIHSLIAESDLEEED